MWISSWRGFLYMFCMKLRLQWHHRGQLSPLTVAAVH